MQTSERQSQKLDWQLNMVWLILLTCAWVIGQVGCQKKNQPENSPSTLVAPSAATEFRVSMVVRHADQPPILELTADCTPQTTLLGWMTQLKDEKLLEFTQRGEGALSFIETIAGQGDPRGTQGFWTYRINGQVIKQSCGAVLLKANDRVEWVLGGKVDFDQ